MVTVEELAEELDRESANTRRTLARVPADRMDWRPHPRSLSRGQLAMHVASLPGALSEIALQSQFQTGTPIPRPSASGPEELLRTLESSVSKARTTILGMGDAGLREPWRMMNGEAEVMSIPRAVFIRSIVLNHWYHHRGQLMVYLRLLEVPVPAVYGDSADEKQTL